MSQTDRTNEDAARPRLSVCMIVKNEAHNLRRCLESVKPITDELIIVDTGSTDATMDIAREYGAKIYEHPWQKDFSLHRNQSLSYATGDWILQIDADEELAPGSARILQETLRQAPENVCGFAVILQDYNQEGLKKLVFTYPRLYRNSIGVYYQGIVHNQVVLPGPPAPSEIVLNHYGYDLDRRAMLRKFKRSVTLLKKQVREAPENPMPYFYLSNTYSMFYRHEKVIEYAEKTIALLRQMDSVSPHYVAIYFAYINSLLALNRLDEAIAAAEESIHIKPNYVDGHYKLSRLYYMKKQLDLSIRHGREFLRWREAYLADSQLYENTNIYTLALDFRLKFWLGTALICREDVAAGRQCLEEALDSPHSEHSLAIESCHNILSANQKDVACAIARKAYQRYADDAYFLLLLAQELACVDLLGWLEVFLRERPPRVGGDDIEPIVLQSIELLLPENRHLGARLLQDLHAGESCAFLEKVAAFLLDNQNKEQPVVQSGAALNPVLELLHAARAIQQGQACSESYESLADQLRGSELPSELRIMLYLIQLYQGMRDGDIAHLVDGLSGCAKVLAMVPPSELDDVSQILQFLVDVTLLSDRKLYPDAGHLAIAVAEQFFQSDVKFEAFKYERQIRRAERDGPYDPAVRLFFRYILPVKQNWITQPDKNGTRKRQVQAKPVQVVS